MRPHAEEKKCFDLVTRECPERDAVAGVGVFDPEVAKLPMGSPFLEESIPSGFSQRLAGPPPALPRHLGTLCPFNPALGVSLAAFTEEGLNSPRRSSKLKTKRGRGRAWVMDEWRAVILFDFKAAPLEYFSAPSRGPGHP